MDLQYKRHTTTGFLWLITETASVKLATLVAQVFLAWLLSGESFGLYGLALTVASLTALIEWAGTRDILIRRGKRIHLWMASALWLSLGMGTLAWLVMCALSPVAGWAYQEPTVIGLILVIALRAPAESSSIPAAAYLASSMRFRALALVSGTQLIATAVLSVTFAMMGFEAYSFALPLPIASACGSIMMWSVARPPMRWRHSLRRVRFLLRDSTSLTLANLMRGLTNRSAYFALGLFHAAQIVGIYVFAFNLASQILRMINVNLSRVLMPVFTCLNDQPKRQLKGCLKVTETLNAFGFLACFLQAAAAPSLFNLIFEDRWQPSLIIFQVLCIGLAMRMPEASALSLLKGLGRFKTIYWLCQISLFVFLCSALPVAWLCGPLAMAVTVLIWATAFGMTTLYLALRTVNGTAGQMLGVYLRPAMSIAPPVALGWYIASLITNEGASFDLIRVALILVIGSSLSIVCLRLISPVSSNAIAGTVMMIRDKIKPKRNKKQFSGLNLPSAPSGEDIDQ